MGRPPIHDGCPTVEYHEKQIRRYENKLRRLPADDEDRDVWERDLAKVRADLAELPEPMIHTVYIRKSKPDRWVAVGRMCVACRWVDDPYGL